MIYLNEEGKARWEANLKDALKEQYGREIVDAGAALVAAFERRMERDNDKPVTVMYTEAVEEAIRGRGMTGFQVGCMVFELTKCWSAGEGLRLWWNEYNLGPERCKEANEQPGGVVDPSAITFDVPEGNTP